LLENYATLGFCGRFLLSVDKDLAECVREEGCSCGGRLHRANYPRAPRGGLVHLPEEYRCRFSFCCDRDGCRKRVTPPSVRFLGRKVYLAAVVVLISAMRQGPTPRRVRELTGLFGVDKATVARWQAFWRDYVPQTPFGRWRVLASCLWSRTSPCHGSWKRSGTAMIPMRAGCGSCDFCHRLRSRVVQ
jgi:hypothetical protein